MLAEGEDCVICSTWRLEDGNSAHPIVVRITTQAMYRFRSAHYSQRADMSARFASNLQMYILDGHYDVGDTSPPAFTIVVDDLFLLETR